MPYKDLIRRREFHREYYREYMKTVGRKYRKTSDERRSKLHKYWKENGVWAYKFRRVSRKYGKDGIKVLIRDNFSCCKCGETDFRLLVIDHIIPKKDGGSDNIDNLHLYCYNCHALKHFMEDIKAEKIDQSEWDKYWMGLACFLGRYSNCLSRQIGAVLVKDNSILSIGWNSTPDGFNSCTSRNPNDENICPRKLIGVKSGDRLDMCIAIHAEMSCIINACRDGVSIKNSTLYCDCSVPCKNCLISIINGGINRVVCNSNSGNDFGKFYDKISEFILNNSSLKLEYTTPDIIISENLFNVEMENL